LMSVVRESYEILGARNDIIILEGAGSPAEINLKAHDIVNMRMAELADAHCLLVGDIDRGGVFASLLGTLELLDPTERARIHGFAINKFRGDVTLLLPGIRSIVGAHQKTRFFGRAPSWIRGRRVRSRCLARLYSSTPFAGLTANCAPSEITVTITSRQSNQTITLIRHARPALTPSIGSLT